MDLLPTLFRMEGSTDTPKLLGLLCMFEGRVSSGSFTIKGKKDREKKTLPPAPITHRPSRHTTPVGTTRDTKGRNMTICLPGLTGYSQSHPPTYYRHR